MIGVALAFWNIACSSVMLHFSLCALGSFFYDRNWLMFVPMFVIAVLGGFHNWLGSGEHLIGSKEDRLPLTGYCGAF